MNPIRSLLFTRRHRTKSRDSVRLYCQRLEDRRVPASFHGLGFLQGAVASEATGVSADSSVVVGDCYYEMAGNYRAFRWTAATGMVDLGLLPGAVSAQASAVSADGSAVVGGCRIAPGIFRAFRWTAVTGMVDLGFLSAGTSAYALAVSADGSVIVGSCQAPGSRAFRWTQPTGMVDLGFLPGGAVADARGVSADGSVIVGWCHPSGGDYQAFRWTSATGMVSLGSVPGTYSPIATAASVNGSVIVGYLSLSPTSTEAFRWGAATGMVLLGDLPGGDASQAYGVSDDGNVIVGTDYTATQSYRAFRWMPGGGMRDFQDVLTTDYGLGAQLTGWSLRYAYGVLADGQTIVGSGTDPAGNDEAWIAHLDAPPQVSTTQVNGGATQRSRVTDLSVTFSTQVTFATTPTAAFTLTRNSDGAAVGFTATASIVGGVTVVTLNGFTGSATEFGSLADGRYTLTALASQISANDQQMTSNYTFGDAQGLFRMFGDVNGDQTVNGLDFGYFKNAFGTQIGDANYLSYLDLNGDGVINGFDFGQFRTRFGTMLP